MTIFNRALVLMVGGLGALSIATAAMAQENLDANKSGAQLFAADCALCHKSSAGLFKAGGLFGLESFLREHYAASRESAAIIAAYLKSVEKKHVRDPRPFGRTKSGAVKGDEPKSDKPKSDRSKSEKPNTKKTDENKPKESKE
jgi:hypothetical protein